MPPKQKANRPATPSEQSESVSEHHEERKSVAKKRAESAVVPKAKK
jgi:hypothetical protein